MKLTKIKNKKLLNILSQHNLIEQIIRQITGPLAIPVVHKNLINDWSIHNNLKDDYYLQNYSSLVT